MHCFVCGEDSAELKVDGGWNRHIHAECKGVYPLAQEYAERYTYQETEQDDAVLYGMEKAAQLMGVDWNTEVITTSLRLENMAYNEWRNESIEEKLAKGGW